MRIPSRSIEASQRVSHELANVLALMERKIVFAESCTAGLGSALLAQVPGISQWMCGSAATYMAAVKTEWLGVPEALIERFTAVSPETTRAMAGQVLARTPVADLSAAITGHLEPSAAPNHRPVAFVGLAERCGPRVMVSPIERIELNPSTRVARQWQAAVAVLDRATRHLKHIDEIETRQAEGCPLCARPGHRDWAEWSPFPANLKAR